jgi:hypothetical protein
MPTRSPLRVLLLLTVSLALAACSTATDPSGCRSDDVCPAGSRCEAAVCVADARPVASIRPLGNVEAFALVELDGTPSDDPDGSDDIVEHVWSVRAVTARCAAPDVASRTPVARVRFGCQGRYEVSLAVRDRLGVESETRSVDVEVGPSMLAPAVTAGPDVSSEHACSGVPLGCRTTDPIELSASARGGAALRWSVEPPLDRPLEDGARVEITGTPGATRAVIETAGTAISGDWIFRAEAYDAYGVLGVAYTRVSVQNRPPILIATPPGAFPHRFDALRSVFTSSGAIPWSAFDPDGDPVEISAVWRHVGDGGAPFAGSLAPGNVTFAVEVPFGAAEDALFLRGGPDLLRTIDLFARDSNRAEARMSLPIEIANRPPEPAGGAMDTRVRHAFDALRSRYVASARLGAWLDPDGDPLFAAPGAAPCEAFAFDAGTLRVECAAPFDGVPAVDRIAGSHRVPVRVRDPWSDASVVMIQTLEILDSPPTLARTVESGTACVRTLVDAFNFGCNWRFLAAPAEFTVRPMAADPDGDPLLLTAVPPAGGSASPAQAICTAPECAVFRFVQPGILFPCLSPYSAPSQLRATDGAASITIDATPPPSGC